MAESVPFDDRQPSYLRAMIDPKSMIGYVPKNKSIPAWLDYICYGPPCAPAAEDF